MRNGTVKEGAAELKAYKKPRSSRIRKTVRKLHLIVGAITAPIVLIVSLTGALWAFQAEIEGLFEEEWNIEARDAGTIGPLEAEKAAKEVFPERRTHGFVYRGPEEPIEVSFYEKDPEFFRSVYLDPYTGKVLGTEDHTTGFFNVVLAGHMHLWLPERIGGKIVSWGVMLFFLSLLSGLILWWPRNRKEQKKRFRWNMLHWRNLTQKRFDLHAVVGFYALLFALIFAVTGLSMSFTWFAEGLHASMGGDRSAEFRIPKAPSDSSTEQKEGARIEELPRLLKRKYPEAESFEVHYRDRKERAIYVEISTEEGLFYNNDYRYYDPGTLEAVDTETIYRPYDKASLPDRILRMNYDIHVGAIFGLPGKILAFFSSLAIGSLPVTGSLLYWLRRKKKKRTRQRKARRILYRSGKKKREPMARV